MTYFREERPSLGVALAAALLLLIAYLVFPNAGCAHRMGPYDKPVCQCECRCDGVTCEKSATAPGNDESTVICGGLIINDKGVLEEVECPGFDGGLVIDPYQLNLNDVEIADCCSCGGGKGWMYAACCPCDDSWK
jgi:hypothetical protein